MAIPRLLKLAALGIALGACASPLEQGERLYRQGDLRGALEVWSTVEAKAGEYERVQGRLEVVEAELDRMLLRYEKRALFFESEGRLAEAVLYYRLPLKIYPERHELLARVQTLVRELDARERQERSGLRAALDSGDLLRARRHAETLDSLNPFDPALQIEIRQARAGAGAEVLRHLERGKIAYISGDRELARDAFSAVLALDETNQAARGYLSYLRRFEALEAERKVAPAPRSISSEEILAEGHFRSGTRAAESGSLFLALQEYMRALRINPEHAGALRELGGLREQLQPEVEALYSDGKRYFQNEDLHNALRIWQRVLLIDPAHERTLENVERAERILARLEEIRTDGS